MDRARDLVAASSDITITDLLIEGLKAQLEEKFALYRKKTGRAVPQRTGIKLNE